MHLKTPIMEKEVRRLKVGDVVYITGEIATARDRAHKRALEVKKSPVDFNCVYHCGPLAKENKAWKVLSCGPTTSSRVEGYVKDFIERFNTKAMIGKGGFGKGILSTLEKKACVYLSFTGGCGVLAAKGVNKVKEVHWQDLGIAEAVWVLEVERFGPMIVAMDCHKRSLYLQQE
jgi:fumarate hydratase subunit beta